MGARKSIAVVGSGISGLGAAWLLSRRHDVTLFEAEPRAGGHANTIDVPVKQGTIAVDTGFIVYNTASYPNLIALLAHLGVETAPSRMSFAVSLNDGRYEYAGSGLASLFGQPANLVSPSHWRMIHDTLRFFREAPDALVRGLDETTTLGSFLAQAGYSDAFTTQHILPMAAAIWSTPCRDVLDFPASAFIRFFANHGLLQVRNRPEWRTVVGGSRAYVQALLGDMNTRVLLSAPADRVVRHADGATITCRGVAHQFDTCVIATHADDALALLADADRHERDLLGAFRYVANSAILHRDSTQMPLRRRLWSSWNYLGRNQGERGGNLSVTYWMNNLQPIGSDAGDLFVTLNPTRPIAAMSIVSEHGYSHPMFNASALAAQRDLWQLQGRRRTWFCGSYFGYGFHEDGLQAGLAVAEQLGGVSRPWTVTGESGRIHLQPSPIVEPASLEALRESAE